MAAPSQPAQNQSPKTTDFHVAAAGDMYLQWLTQDVKVQVWSICTKYYERLHMDTHVLCMYVCGSPVCLMSEAPR